MRIYQKMKPLTAEEQRFASENHSVIYWCLKLEGYDPDEDYGPAAIGYLKAVQRWFARPELHRYSFRTIAKWAIKSYVGNERKREERCQRQTVSLNAPISGYEADFSLLDTITYDNYLNHYVWGGVKMAQPKPMSGSIRAKRNCHGTRSVKRELKRGISLNRRRLNRKVRHSGLVLRGSEYKRVCSTEYMVDFI